MAYIVRIAWITSAYTEYFAFVNVKLHLPSVCPLVDVVQVCLQGGLGQDEGKDDTQMQMQFSNDTFMVS